MNSSWALSLTCRRAAPGTGASAPPRARPRERSRGELTMKRTILAGLLAVAGLLASAGDAKAIGFGPGGIAFSLGVRISYWYDAGPCAHGYIPPACDAC